MRKKEPIERDMEALMQQAASDELFLVDLIEVIRQRLKGAKTDHAASAPL